MHITCTFKDKISVSEHFYTLVEPTATSNKIRKHGKQNSLTYLALSDGRRPILHPFRVFPPPLPPPSSSTIKPLNFLQSDFKPNFVNAMKFALKISGYVNAKTN